jgi:hypothetical protein
LRSQLIITLLWAIGGKKVLTKVAGMDASKKFKMFHSPDVLKKHSHLLIGTLANSQGGKDTGRKDRKAVVAGDAYGDGMPYGDPNWYPHSSSEHPSS